MLQILVYFTVYVSRFFLNKLTIPIAVKIIAVLKHGMNPFSFSLFTYLSQKCQNMLMLHNTKCLFTTGCSARENQRVFGSPLLGNYFYLNVISFDRTVRSTFTEDFAVCKYENEVFVIYQFGGIT